MATQVYDKAEHGPRMSSTPPPPPGRTSRTSTPPPPPGRTSKTSTPPPPPRKPAGRVSQPGAGPAPLRTSVPPPRPRRAGPAPATSPGQMAPSVEVRDEPPLRGDPTIQDLPGQGAAAMAQQPPRQPRRRRPRERTEMLERPQASNRGTLIALGAMGLLMLLGLGIGAYAVLGPKSPGTIQVVTTPPDAVVLLDEEPVAATSSPFIIRNVPPDTVHLLEVRKEGYRPWSMQVDLNPGEVLQLPPVELIQAGQTAEPPATAAAPEGAAADADEEAAAEPEPEPEPATDKSSAPASAGSGRQIVRFYSQPEGARVEIERGDERRVVGFTPTWARMDVPGGAWTIRMSNLGYKTWEKQIDLPEGEDEHRLRAVLSRKAGTQATSSAAPRRAAPRAKPKPQPKETAPAKSPEPASIGGGEASKPAAEASGNGTLRISTRPWTNVSVGGRNIGSTPQMNVSLPPGRHTVRLTNPEFGIDETITITLEPGQTVTKILNLSAGE
jgi:hypothetical protein